MFESYAFYVGGTAAFLASLSYIPQVKKAWPRGTAACKAAQHVRIAEEAYVVPHIAKHISGHSGPRHEKRPAPQTPGIPVSRLIEKV